MPPSASPGETIQIQIVVPEDQKGPFSCVQVDIAPPGDYNADHKHRMTFGPEDCEMKINHTPFPGIDKDGREFTITVKIPSDVLPGKYRVNHLATYSAAGSKDGNQDYLDETAGHTIIGGHITIK